MAKINARKAHTPGPASSNPPKYSTVEENPNRLERQVILFCTVSPLSAVKAQTLEQNTSSWNLFGCYGLSGLRYAVLLIRV